MIHLVVFLLLLSVARTVIRAEDEDTWYGSDATASGVVGRSWYDFEDDSAVCFAGSEGAVRSTSKRVHVFYYPWYKNLNVDGHNAYGSHWEIGKGGKDFNPSQDDISSSFFPTLGAYSSRDRAVIEKHMEWIERAGIGVVLVSWWGRNSYENSVVPLLLDAASKRDVEIAFYVEPYGGGYKEGRTPLTAESDVKYLVDTYGSHPAFHRVNDRPLFVFFASREYEWGDQREWLKVWDRLHLDSKYNPIAINHGLDIKRVLLGGWDG